MLKDYLFLIKGEPNFVETHSLEDAFEILAEKGFDFVFDVVIYTGAFYTPHQVEIIGYNTY